MTEEYVKPTTTPCEKFDIMHRAFHSFNYRERYWEPQGWSFDWFDVSDARRAIKKALNSPTTTYGRLSVIGISDCDKIVRRVMDPSTGQAREEVSPILDAVRRSACAQCGRPHELKVCTGCRGRYYCSGDCQQVSGDSPFPDWRFAQVYTREAPLERGTQARVQTAEEIWSYTKYWSSVCMRWIHLFTARLSYFTCLYCNIQRTRVLTFKLRWTGPWTSNDTSGTYPPGGTTARTTTTDNFALISGAVVSEGCGCMHNADRLSFFSPFRIFAEETGHRSSRSQGK